MAMGDDPIECTRVREEALRVMVLSSRRAPGLERLISRAGRRWRIVGVVASEPASEALEVALKAGLPALVHDVRAFCAGRGVRLGDLAARRQYDRETLRILRRLEVDLVLLCGYLLIVTEPLLDAFPGRILNVHDSDLTRLDPEGVPRYRGLRSTRDAIVAGEKGTRSTVHLVTEEVDRGPLVIRSWSFPIPPLVDAAIRWGADDVLGAYAYAHREWMMRASWGAILERALDRMAAGEVHLLGGQAVVAGALGPEDVEPEEPLRVADAGRGRAIEAQAGPRLRKLARGLG